MRTRHLGKALAGLAAAAATIGLLGLPASANSATGNITAGTLTVINADSSVLTTQTLGTGTGTGVTCVASSATLTMSGGASTGTWTATQTSTTGVQIGSQWFTSVLTITFASNTTTTWVGTYTGTTGGGTLAGSGGLATAVLRKSTAGTPCTPVAGPCTITVSGITVAGTHTVDPTPTIAVGDTATVSGGTNGEGDLGFEVAVTGTASDCGSLIAADDGAVTFANVVIGVTSVP
jgi:hypothetical protein